MDQKKKKKKGFIYSWIRLVELAGSELPYSNRSKVIRVKR